MTSTAIVSDMFGFGSSATAYNNWIGELSTGRKSPDLLPHALELVATGFGFVGAFGSDAIMLNTTSGVVATFEVAGDFKNGDDHKVNLGYAGSFLAFPFGSLPQQDVTVFGALTYEYLNNGAVRTGGDGKGESDGDTLYGNNGADKHYGGNGSDYLFGGAGDDRLDGGRGTDYFTGGTGADRFIMEESDLKGAYIKDFGRGNDVLDFTDFDVRTRDVTITYNDNLAMLSQ